MLQSLAYCRKEKGMEIFAWCIMSSHPAVAGQVIHLIFRAKENNPSDLMKSLKVYTSKQLQEQIGNNIQESR
jgi:REP element-mobilizing transposase RayT